MKRIAACVLATGLACAPSAHADVIATIPVTFRNFYPVGSPAGRFLDDIVISVGGQPIPPSPRPPVPIPIPNEVLESFRLSPVDVGKTFVATRDNDPQLAAFADLLTASGNEFYFSTKVFAESPDGSGNGAGSSQDVRGFSLGALALFRNYDITSVSNTLNSLTITDNVTPIPTSPQIHGRQFDGTTTLVVEGTPIPEPASATLLLLATGALTLRRRTRRA